MSRRRDRSRPQAAGAAPHTLSFAQALALAEQHLAAGRLAAAEDLCRRILAADAAHAPALHLTGIVALRAGNIPAAIDFVRRACEADPGGALGGRRRAHQFARHPRYRLFGQPSAVINT